MCRVCETRTPEQKQFVNDLMDIVSDVVNMGDKLDADRLAQIQAAYGFGWMNANEWEWINDGLALLAMPSEDWVPEEIQ